jgi:hypothetical protein
MDPIVVMTRRVICHRVPNCGPANAADYQADWAAYNRTADCSCDGAAHQAVLVSHRRNWKRQRGEYDADC